MAKVDDNYFPKIITDMQTSAPAAPTDRSWKLYAKANGIFARSSNTEVGPFGTGGGSGSITASGYTQTTARLLGRTTAATGAIEEITVSSPLTLSAGALSAVLTQSNADSSADVTLTADTIADATGVSVSLAAGTWVIMAQVTFLGSNAAFDYTLAAITDSSNVVYGEARGQVNSSYNLTVPIFAVVTPGGTTTYKVRGQSGRTNNLIKRYSSGTQVGTKMIAIRVL